jgi:hypothetical protein
MRIYQTDLQKEAAKRPTKVDFDTVKNDRGLLTTDEEKYKYRLSVLGEQGEETVLQYLQKYGMKDWLVVRNLWMNYFGPFENDLTLFTSHKMHVLEIKHFKGEYTYNNGLSKLDGVRRNINPVHQARRNYSNVQEMMNEISASVRVEGALVFSGVDNFVDIQSEVADLQIIPRNYLYTYIRKIVQEEQSHRGRALNPEILIAQLEKYEIEKRFVPEPLSKEEMMKTKRGIYCAHCKSYDIQVRKHVITCRCGFIENREEATVRTICDYGVLNYDKELTRKELLVFFNGQLSKTYLINILNKHFTRVAKNSYTYYINKKLPYFRIKFSFDIE